MENLKRDNNTIIEANDYVLNSVQDIYWIPIDQAEKLLINGFNIIFGKTLL